MVGSKINLVDTGPHPAILGSCLTDQRTDRPRDPDQLAYQIMLGPTGQAEPFDPEAPKPVDPTKNPMRRL